MAKYPYPRNLKMTQENKAKFVELIAAGNTTTAACQALDVGTTCIWNNRRRDQVFDARVREAQQARIDMMVDALHAKGSAGDVTAAIFLLCNWTRNLPPEDRYESVQHIKHGGDDTPIKLEGKAADDVDWSQATVDELRQLRDLRQRIKERTQSKSEGGTNGTSGGQGHPRS